MGGCACPPVPLIVSAHTSRRENNSLPCEPEIAARVDLQELGRINMPDLDEGRRAEQQVRRVETDGIGPSFPFDDLTISVRLSVPVPSA